MGGVERDVGGAEDLVAEEAAGGDVRGGRRGERGEDVEVGAGYFIEAVGLAGAVVEEGAEVGSGEMQAGVERGLDDDVERALGGEQNAGLDEETESPFGLRAGGQ